MCACNIWLTVNAERKMRFAACRRAKAKNARSWPMSFDRREIKSPMPNFSRTGWGIRRTFAKKSFFARVSKVRPGQKMRTRERDRMIICRQPRPTITSATLAMGSR